MLPEIELNSSEIHSDEFASQPNENAERSNAIALLSGEFDSEETKVPPEQIHQPFKVQLLSEEVVPLLDEIALSIQQEARDLIQQLGTTSSVELSHDLGFFFIFPKVRGSSVQFFYFFLTLYKFQDGGEWSV
jgi:hypothetical protein